MRHRHATPPLAIRLAPFKYSTIANEKYSRFIHLFIYDIILTNGYRTIRALLCDISQFNAVLFARFFSQQTRMDWNELKWIQNIFKNIASRMLKWMFFNPECIYSFIGIAWSISLLPFNLKIILAFLCIMNIVQNFE